MVCVLRQKVPENTTEGDIRDFDLDLSIGVWCVNHHI